MLKRIILVIIIVFAASCFFILPPRVVSVAPSNQSNNVSLTETVVIKFDRPVNRNMLNHNIYPEAYGEWKFEDPLIKNHFYRTLVFIPAVDFNPSTQYQVKLKNISSPLIAGLESSYSFSFRTKDVGLPNMPKEAPENIEELDNLVDQSSLIKKAVAEQPKPKITLINVAFDHQDYTLSCEAASLKMALAAKGKYVSENQIMEKVGYDGTQRNYNTWGDPYEYYVGDINGKMCTTGYGVYWEPLAKAASNWCPAEAISGWNLKGLLKEIEAGNPVVIWGALPVKNLTDCSWYTPEGKYVKAYKEAHVRLVVGFVGEIDNPSKIIINDPLSGRIYWSTSYFLTNWKTFGNSAVVVR